MLILLTIHLVVAGSAPSLVRILGRRAFWLLSVPSLVTFAWAALNLPSALHHPDREVHRWIPSISLSIDLRMDALSLLLTLIIAGIGVLVLCYCAGYFTDDEPELGRFATHLAGFAGVMLGLVWSNNLLLLYLFWELTTVLSYLLVGHHSEDIDSRRAATQALVVTTFGGLGMLVGLVMVGQAAGTYQLDALLAHPPAPTLGLQVALGLILLGAVTKSALVPFHFWLPGAMAAPTPVSAYLHAAAMVKAGVYLVARFAPTFADQPVWQPIVLVLGGATMLIGGYRSLRQHDLKLLLAYGTVSQLGFMILLVGGGSRNLALAGLALLVCHSVFKACLFLTVGAIDHATGTRDLRTLHRLGRSMPVLAVASVLAAASMAGVPPMIGFVGKEAAYAALLHAEDPWHLVMLAVVVAGSVLTFAYSARFCWGAWGPAPVGAQTGVGPATGTQQAAPLAASTDASRVTKVPRATTAVDPADGASGAWSVVTQPHANPGAVTGPPVLLGALCLALAPFTSLAEPLLDAHAELFAPSSHSQHLGLWHGFNTALVLSLLTLAAGAGLFWARAAVERLQRSIPHAPAAVSAYRLTMRWLDRISIEISGLVFRGSLPQSLSLILLVVLIGPGYALLTALRPGLEQGAATPHWFDSWAQIGAAVLIAAAAVAAVRSRRRMRGVFMVGVTGYGAAMLFLLHGAPDLALTQVLVETVSIVVFILVLRRFSGRFRNLAEERRTMPVRLLLGIGAGIVVAGSAMVATMARTAAPDSVTMPRSAAEFGGGYNVVNVILVDIRAWDTMGEISVVLVAATGVASLIFLRSQRVSALRDRLRRSRERRGAHHTDSSDSVGWLVGTRFTPDANRSMMLEVITRLIFHTVMVWSVFLLFTGHNAPGGGFAGGLMAGLALTLRYLAGGAQELRAAIPLMPGLLLGIGLFLSAGAGLVSMVFGGDVLQSWTFDIPVPLIGHIHLVTSMFFDIGVYLVVVGLMLDVLRSLGAGIDSEVAASDSDNLVADPLVEDGEEVR